MLNKISIIHLKIFFSTSVMSFQQFVIGGVFGFSVVILPQLQQPNDLHQIDSEQSSWIASLPLLLCPIGSLVFGYMSDKLGRKNALQLTYIPLIISWVLLYNAQSLKEIYIGRLIAGLSTGTGGVIYVYIAETSPTDSRPFYLLIYTLYVGLGMLASATLGVLFHWRVVAAMFSLSCAVGMLAPFLVPSTPMWLRSHGRNEEASKAERWFGIRLPCAEDLPAFTAATMATPNGTDSAAVAIVRESTCGCWDAYKEPTVWKPALAALAFFCCQQGSGFYMLLFYSVDVLRDFRAPVDCVAAAIYLSVARLAGTVVSLMFQSVPKRTLTAVSGLGMCASLSAVICYAHVFRDVDDPPYGNLLLGAFLSYVFFAMFAVLPLPWSVCGEIFPMSVKGTMNGILYSCGYELMFVVLKAYPILIAVFGIQAVWTACAVMCFVTALFGAFVLPETTGKTLNEIIDGFKSHQKPAKVQIPDIRPQPQLPNV